MAGLDGTTAALAALQRVDFDTARTLSSVWRDTEADVPELNGSLVRSVVEEVFATTGADRAGNPLGRVVLGNPGAGKTHLLGAIRRALWERGGWFVLIDLLDVREFWETAAHCYVSALGQVMADRRSQGQAMAARIADRARMSPGGRGGFLDWLGVTRNRRAEQLAEGLLSQVRSLEPNGARDHRDVIAAFACMVGGDEPTYRAARDWLIGIGDAEDEELAPLRLRPAMPRRVVEGLSWLMALTGPTVCAVDQIDAIVSVMHADAEGSADAQRVGARITAVIDGLAGGLMALREVTHRSITLLSTLGETWEILETRAIGSFRGRFEPPERLLPITRPEVARRVVERRLARPYQRAGFAPPYPSWPFQPEAFDAIPHFTPRELLVRCEAHRRRCLVRGIVTELDSFERPQAANPAQASASAPILAAGPGQPGPAATDLDAAFSGLLGKKARAAEEARANGAALADLLQIGLNAWVREADPELGEERVLDLDVPGLTARIRVGGDGAQEQHLAFCIITQSNAVAVQSRLGEAMRASGIEPGLPFRHLLVLRDQPWPSGPRTAALVREFELAGGRIIFPSAEVLAAFAAMKALDEDAAPGVADWLRARRPMGALDFFRRLPLSGSPRPASAAAVATAPPAAGVVEPEPEPERVQGPDAVTEIPVGVRAGEDRPLMLPLGLLPRHVAVVAGAGAGQTMLLRRLVEEAALAGIPAVVLDSSGDLVRLGEAWPERPDAFGDADVARAEQYARAAEVVVWTPARPRGNPLSFPPLPDFPAPADDPDALAAIIDIAAATLTAMLPPAGAQASVRHGVLTAALRRFAASGGGGGLDGLIGVLQDLPAEASPIERAPKLAADLADQLLAAQARTPQPRADDPARLLRGAEGRVRVSVISLGGLSGEAARQEFVGRLMLALLGFVRRVPGAAGRPVQALLVIEEAQVVAQANGATPARALAAFCRQARRHGLGVVLATQSPRGIDAGTVGLCGTQVFGRANAPQALEAIRDMMAGRGGAADDLGRLPRGTFYFSIEGMPRPVRCTVTTPLSHQPGSALTEDEVVALAARSHPEA